MNDQVKEELTKKYLEFRNTSTKIGLEEAIVQYKSIGQDWRFDFLCELYFISVNVTSFNSEIANKNIRGNTRLLNNEVILKENGILITDLILLFDNIEYTQGVKTSWKHILEGVLHLTTRLDMVQYLIKSDEIDYRDMVDHLLSCVVQLDSRYLIQLSDMIFKIVEEYPTYAKMTRFKLIEMQILPDLVTKLTVIYCKDTIEFLNGIFHRKSKWIMNHLQDQFKINHLPIAIRPLIGLIGYFGIKLIESDILLFIKLLNETTSERLVELLLCLILISADQFLRKQKELSQVLLKLLKSEISELPILFFVYFQTDSINQIEETIRSILSMQVPIPKLGLFEIQKLFRSLKLLQ